MIKTPKTPELQKEIIHLYVDEKYTISEIMEAKCLTCWCVYTTLTQFGVNRSSGESILIRHKRRKRKYSDNNELLHKIKCLYVDENKSSKEISDKLNMNQPTVSAILRDMGINRSLSEAMKITTNKPESKKRVSDEFKELWQNPEHRKNISEKVSISQIGNKNGVGNKGNTTKIRHAQTSETCHKLSVVHKELWANPEYAKTHGKNFMWKQNKREKQLENIIRLVSNDFVFYGELKYGSLCGGVPDFVDGEHKKIIQHNGCYYHACALCNSRWNLEIYKYLKSNEDIEIDENKKYIEKGYSVLVIWEHELKKNPDDVLQRVVAFIK